MYHINWKWKHHPSYVHVRCALFFPLSLSIHTSFWEIDVENASSGICCRKRSSILFSLKYWWLGKCAHNVRSDISKYLHFPPTFEHCKRSPLKVDIFFAFNHRLGLLILLPKGKIRFEYLHFILHRWISYNGYVVATPSVLWWVSLMEQNKTIFYSFSIIATKRIFFFNFWAGVIIDQISFLAWMSL